jgi:hypothetical protein
MLVTLFLAWIVGGPFLVLAVCWLIDRREDRRRPVARVYVLEPGRARSARERRRRA